MNHRSMTPPVRAHLWIGAVALILCSMLALSTVVNAKLIKGTDKSDQIVGTKKKDKIKGRDGGDTIKGRGGKDVMRGGSGNDMLDGEGGKDRFNGGGDNDTLKAVDGKRDRRINGGPGDDTCEIDQIDLNRIRACETLEARGEEPAGSLKLLTASGLVCASALPTCTFELTGNGAEDIAGTVTGGGGVNPGAGASVSVSGEDWTAAGAYGCTTQGFLRVEIGAESIDVPVTCLTENP